MKEQRKKILWLCSWYPGKTEPFNGDFIQRHAKAASLFNDVYVIHVIGDITGKFQKPLKEISKNGRLTEHIIYYKKASGFIGRIKSKVDYLFFFRQAIRRYMIENGKPDIVHVHIPFKAGLLGLWIQKRYRVPYIVSEHWGIYNEAAEDNFFTRSRFFKKLTKKVISKATSFVSVSKFLGNGVKEILPGRDYVLIPNTVNSDLFYYKEKPQGKFRFIHVSNMVPLKNAEGILRSFRVFCQGNTQAELIMVGDTDPAIRKYAQELNFDEGRVLFKGEVSYLQVALQMQAAHCLVLFSDIENSPCVISEALCCGLSVIATHVGGVPELVDTSNSILIQPHDENELSEAMNEMMNSYSKYNGKKIAAEAREKFSYPVIGQLFDDLYEKTLFHNTALERPK